MSGQCSCSSCLCNQCVQSKVCCPCSSCS
jgi:hypothetical protein